MPATRPQDFTDLRTTPIPFAVREPLPGTDLDAGPPGLGVSMSLRAEDGQALQDQLMAHDVPIMTAPFDARPAARWRASGGQLAAAK